MKMYDVSIVISEIEEPDVEIPPGTEIPTKELGVTPLIMTESLDEAKEIYNLCSELGDSVRKIAVFHESDEWPNKRDGKIKKIPLQNSILKATVDDENYKWLSCYTWYPYLDPETKKIYAAHDTPSGRRVFMHDVIMGLDTLED